MIKVFIVFGTLLTPLFFPFWFTLVCAFGATFFSSLIPLAMGVLLDVLYYTPQAFSFPLYSALGILATLLAFIVRRFVQTSIIR